MSQDKSKYSLWIVPRGEAGEMIQTLVDKLSDEYQAPQFVPHLTLVANIFADTSEIDDMSERIKQCADQLNPFSIKFTDYGYTDEEFRSLYLLVESLELQSVYESISTHFPQVLDEHFRAMPHVSVLYGNYSEETKKQIIDANPLRTEEFMIKSLDLYLTNNQPENWQLKRSFPLR